jgi:glycine/D-amino acid oxidase-like deaminating enzyme
MATTIADNDRIVIVGGGIIGCLCAYYLRELGHRGAVTVLEPDPTYRFASTALSAASIRAQFATPVNVELSLFGIGFLRSVRDLLHPETDIGLVENGYLILADEAAAAPRRQALAMQRSLGADIEEMDPAAVRARFPWLNVDDIAFATFGRTGEGWFDAWALLQSARRAALERNVTIKTDAAEAFETRGDWVTSVVCASHDRLEADWFINAAGALSGQVSAMLGTSIPIAPRKRTVFHFKAPVDAAGMPMLFDRSGAWMRPEGDGFIGGIQPHIDDDFDAHDDFEPHHELFHETLWPLLAQRVPALEELRLLSAWAGHYEMNLFDHNGIVGPSTDLPNFFYATGFSGHGVMHSPGVARGVAERLRFGAYRSIDLTPLSVGRIERNEPLPESAIY